MQRQLASQQAAAAAAPAPVGQVMPPQLFTHQQPQAPMPQVPTMAAPAAPPNEAASAPAPAPGLSLLTAAFEQPTIYHVMKAYFNAVPQKDCCASSNLKNWDKAQHVLPGSTAAFMERETLACCGRSVTPQLC